MEPDTHFVKLVIVLTTIAIILLIALLGYLILFFNKKEISTVHRMEMMRNDFEKTLLTDRLKVREQTFHKISQEIHDNIGHMLSITLIRLETIPRKELGRLAAYFEESIQMTRKTADEIRDLTRILHPDYIKREGLLYMLDLEMDRIKKRGKFKVQYEVTGDPLPMDSNKELLILRIMQEVLNNTIKHADATEIQVQVHYTAEGIEVELSDNGTGFHPAENKTGITGLIDIAKWANLIGGICGINSQPDKRKNIILKVPY